MVGIGETYFPAFALALSMSQVASGLITTIPLLIGAVLQLVSPYAVRRFASHRLWVILTVMLQAASFVPLVLAAAFGRAPIWLIFAVAAIYFGSGMAAGPAWTTWVATLVPEGQRARYFARRNRISQTSLLLGQLAGGGVLYLGARHHMEQAAFGAIFFIAAACRFISARLISWQTEPVPMPEGHRHVPVAALFSRMGAGAKGRLILFILTMHTAVYMAHPYFTAYALERLRVNYVVYVLLIGAPYVARIAALPLLGRIAHRHGARTLLWIGAVGFVLLACLWISVTATVFLVAVQLLGGVAWAAWELATLLVMFEVIDQSERTSILTYYNVGDSLSKMLGSLVGGRLLSGMGATHAAYLTLFAASMAARAAAMLLIGHAKPGATPRDPRTAGKSGAA